MNRRDFLKTTSAALTVARFMPTGTRLAAQVPTLDVLKEITRQKW